MKAYKAFDQNLQCRGFQFEVGKTYEHEGKVVACESGFHACENPIDIWTYYPLNSRYAVVDLSGEVHSHDSDSKLAAARITISAEIGLPQIIADGVVYLLGLCENAFVLKPDTTTSGHDSQLAASGDYSQLAASGDYSQLAASGHDSQLAASGDNSKLAASGSYNQLAASGYRSQLAASGYRSQLAASGDSSQLAASGDNSQLVASGDGSKLVASGDGSKLVASGDGSKLVASGDGSKLVASGDGSICVSAGLDATAQVGDGGAIALTYHDGVRRRIAVAYVGEDGIKPNTLYRVSKQGVFEEIEL